jgi:MoaA/NifB/PqqE/SkfB family radical SAM enzyme
MKTEDWLTLLNDAAALGCRQVQFIGGEPTLHPGLKAMIAFAVARRYRFIEVFTNATTIDDRLIGSFIKNDVHVATSFYSDQRAVHDSITHHPGSFDRTVSNIKRFVASGIPLRVGIIETPANAGHANSAKSFLKQLGVSEIRVDIQRQVGRGAQPLKIQTPLSELCGECSNGKLCVTASGSIYPCVFSRFAGLGDANNGIANALSCDALAEFRKALEAFVAKEKVGCKKAVHNLVRDRSTTVDEICGPDIICSPDTECSPNCIPGSSRCVPSMSPCVPATPCMPYRRTATDREIQPR